MKSLLQTLHDNESILLLYLFDELPAEDRAEVDSMLAGDESLRSQLNELSASHDRISSALEQADAANMSSISTSLAQRQAAQAIDRWNTRRVLSIPRETSVQPAGHRKWIAYSSGIAAAILAGLLIYRGMSSDSPDRLAMKNISQGPYWTQQQRDVLDLFPAPDPDASMDSALALALPPENTDMLQKSLDPSEELLNDSLKHVDLSSAERELNAVAQLSDPSAISSGLNFE